MILGIHATHERLHAKTRTCNPPGKITCKARTDGTSKDIQNLTDSNGEI